MEDNSRLWVELVMWLAIAAVIVLSSWKNSTRGVGILPAFVFLFWGVHWFPAFLYVLPWYYPLHDPGLIKAGFEQSLIGLFSFAVGSFMFGWILSHRTNAVVSSQIEARGRNLEAPAGIARHYLMIGAVSYFALAPLALGLPTFNALTAGATGLLKAGLALAVFQAWRTRNRKAMITRLAVIGVWPVVTTAFQGFLGFGVIMIITMGAFVFQLTGFRLRMLPLGLVVGYVGLSVLVTYGVSREYIRSVVWGENVSYTSSLESVFTSLGNFEWFDPYNPSHFRFIEERQEQNWFVGLAEQRISSGLVDYDKGSTFLTSILALVPRILWRDKPIVAGGSQQVMYYTGIYIFGATSTGAGQVLEFYANFGPLGVFFGFLALGALLSFVDRKAAWFLRNGDWERFAVLYVPALAALQPANSLMSLIPESVAGLAAVILINQGFVFFVSRRKENSNRSPNRHPNASAETHPLRSGAYGALRKRDG